MYRTILFLGVLGAAAFGPILVLSMRGGGPTLQDRIKNIFANNAAAEHSTTDSPPSDGPHYRDPRIAALLQAPSLPAESKVVQPVVTPLPEILRFDITPTFVTQRWPRVSSNLPDLDFHGMRVPVMTGTGPQELHGSASYFFNRSHQLERVRLHGFTDDPAPAIQFVTATYRLREYAANSQRLFLSYYKGQPLSMLRIQRSTEKDQDLEVFIEINAPVEDAKLSDESMSYLTSLRDANLL